MRIRASRCAIFHEDQSIEVRDLANLVELWFRSVGRNAGLLLNIPPDKRGLLHENDVAALRAFGDYLKNTFRHDLLGGVPKNVTSPAPNTVEQTFCPVEALDFNCIVVGEDLTQGQEIRACTVEAEIDGAWVILWQGACVGHKRAVYFDPVRATKLRLRATGATKAPVIRNFGAYQITVPEKKRTPGGFMGRNYLDSSSAIIEKKDTEIYIQLGGIRPFNTLKLEGYGVEKMEVSIFNGSTFEPHGEAPGGEWESFYSFGTIVDWSYRLKVKITPSPAFDMNACLPKLYLFEG